MRPHGFHAAACVLVVLLSGGGRARADDAPVLRGARALDEGRDAEAVRALEGARQTGFRPARALFPLLVVAYARLGDLERARLVVRQWGPAAPALVARLERPRLATRAELGVGWDGNVRLDPARAASGVSAPFASARVELAARPFARADENVAVSLEQRVHLAERQRTALYDLAVATIAAGSERLLGRGPLLVGADAFGQLLEADLWRRHAAFAGGASLSAGLHPVGPHTFGLQGALQARDLDGESLGDPTLDRQDAIGLAIGPFARLGLPRLGRLEIDAGWEEAMARGAEWDERGAGAGAALDLRLGPIAARANGRWHLGHHPEDDRVEHRLAALVEAAWASGPVTPFVRLAADASITRAPWRYERFVGLAGVSAGWRTP